MRNMISITMMLMTTIYYYFVDYDFSVKVASVLSTGVQSVVPQCFTPATKRNSTAQKSLFQISSFNYTHYHSQIKLFFCKCRGKKNHRHGIIL